MNSNHRITRHLGLLAAVSVIAAAVGVLGAPPAAAATFTVTTTDDGGAGSLREAFALASASAEANEIVLQAGETYTLDDCAEGDLDHTGTDPLTISGNGATIVQTCVDERVIESNGDLVVTDLTVSGGVLPGGLGGGIEADTSSVTLERSTVTGNEASVGGGVAAIRVTLVDSTVSANIASSTGGGVWADQTLSATNSTITGNAAGTAGGGLTVVNDAVTLLYSTVSSNTAPLGANVEIQAGGDELISFASVLSQPLGGGAACALDAGVATNSQGANVSSDGSCGFGAGVDDLVDAGDVALGALGDNGGPTQTMVPPIGSVLLDRADCASSPVAITADQRGVGRPQGARCDVGAVEVVVDPATTPESQNGTTPPAAPVPGAPRPDAALRFTG